MTTEKSAAAYRTIGEVADAVGEPPHVLRFWETKIAQLRPALRAKGRRRYRPEEARLVEAVHRLVRERGVTLDGVKKLIAEQGRPGVFAAAGMGPAATPDAPRNLNAQRLSQAIAELERARAALTGVL
ncbi:MAG: MerR family transcriptional regulator [Pseudomonadota bacterium]